MASEKQQLCTYCKRHVPNEYDWNFAVEGSKYCCEHQHFSLFGRSSDPLWEKIPGIMYLVLIGRALKGEWMKNHPPRPQRQKSKSTKQDRSMKILAFVVVGLLLLWVGLFLLRPEWTAASPPSGEVIQTLASTPTPTLVSVEVAAINEVIEEVVVQEGVVYLRVETQRLDTAYTIWRREPGIPVFLSPFVEGDAVPNAQRENTFRQVTEELLTADSVLVAVTTFEAQPGMYWVWVDGCDLLAGCSVWVPRFVEDADSDIIVGEPVVVRLDAYEGFNTFVLKFQIVCRQVALGPTPTVVRTSPPQETPTDPSDTPVPTSTSPPPVSTLTPEPTICVSCLPPLTPVATPTSYPTSVSTPTAVFED